MKNSDEFFAVFNIIKLCDREVGVEKEKAADEKAGRVQDLRLVQIATIRIVTIEDAAKEGKKRNFEFFQNILYFSRSEAKK